MKYLIFSLLLILLVPTSFGKGLDYSTVGKVPILDGGRIKPLDTFARVNLLAIHEKSSLKGVTAIEWLMELLFDPSQAYNRKVFKIRNKEVVQALNLSLDAKHDYAFIDVSQAISRESRLVDNISKIPETERTPTQKQIYDLYFKVSRFYELSRSLTLLLPQFRIPSQEYAEALKLPFDAPLTYMDLLKRKASFSELVEKVLKKEGHDESGTALLKMGRMLEIIETDKHTQALRIIPPTFQKSKDVEWLSPWQTVQRGFGNPVNAGYFNKWSALYLAYMTKDPTVWAESSKELYEYSLKISEGLVDQKVLESEYRYNSWDLFTKALAFYILSFLLLSMSVLGGKRVLERLALGSLVIGSVMHLINVILRCYIMARPPVSTLYESIIFVAYIAVFAAIAMELRRRNNLGTFIGSALGAILLFMSFGYEKDGDSMGMLAAVLDTNFWLATHVVTITIGYGCCFVASLLGHVYLGQRVMEKYGKRKYDMDTTLKNMLGVTLFALFFTILGTILGGIWADQSWGRFWGWDPKENGAMLICMWLLWSVHGRLTTYFNNVAFAISTVLTSVVVAFAWFGVNLLNVGLHSYGFTESIAKNLYGFTILEILFCGVAYLLIVRERKAVDDSGLVRMRT